MEKEKVEVVIMGKVHTIIGNENKEYLQKLATYIDTKLREVTSHPSFRRMSLENKQLFINLNLAEDYCKAKDWADQLEKDKLQSQEEIYKLKEKIVDLEVQLSHQLGRLKELERITNAKKN